MAQYTVAQAMKAQAALRSAAGAGEERFDEEQLIGMLSDEIRMLREKGVADGEIAALLRRDAGVEIDADGIGKYYVDTSGYDRPR